MDQHTANFFGDFIDVRTRAETIRSGDQIEIPPAAAKYAGLTAPAAVTSAVFEDCVHWTDEDSNRTGVTLQDQDDRMADLANATAGAIAAAAKRANGPATLPLAVPFTFDRYSRDDRFGPDDDMEPTAVRLVAVLGQDFDGTHIITVMTDDEHTRD